MRAWPSPSSVFVPWEKIPVLAVLVSDLAKFINSVLSKLISLIKSDTIACLPEVTGWQIVDIKTSINLLHRIKVWNAGWVLT